MMFLNILKYTTNVVLVNMSKGQLKNSTIVENAMLNYFNILFHIILKKKNKFLKLLIKDCNIRSG